jgi:DNA-binding IclR family transcriptional regulator
MTPAAAAAPPPDEPPAEAGKDPQFAYTLAKGLQVLRAFDPTVQSLGNREIAQRTGIHRATVVRLTRTLAMLGYLKYNEATARYRLAAPVLSFAYPLLCHLSVRQLARPHMQALADFSHGAVSLAMRGQGQLVLVETCVHQGTPTGRPDVGALRGFADTSLGHVYYSATTDDERQEIDALLQRDATVNWPAARRQLAASRKHFAATGYCVVVQADSGLQGTAVPLDHLPDGELMVMNCVVPPFHLQEDTIEKQIAPRLLDLVRLLKTAVGRR